MLHSIDPTILFLQEEDVIKAGALDMRMTLEAVEETYRMFGKGELLNPPKTHMEMPIGCNGNWESFFNTMPCYLGKDINIGGVKWAAEAKNNSNITGIPYGIDITILSDPETVLPFCILDGTLITAMRTSAVAGVFAKCSRRNVFRSAIYRYGDTAVEIDEYFADNRARGVHGIV